MRHTTFVTSKESLTKEAIFHKGGLSRGVQRVYGVSMYTCTYIQVTSCIQAYLVYSYMYWSLTEYHQTVGVVGGEVIGDVKVHVVRMHLRYRALCGEHTDIGRCTCTHAHTVHM